jgi:hypothetical protein
LPYPRKPTRANEFPTNLHLYYALSRSLRKGVNARKRLRPGIPIEVIVIIFDMAGFIKTLPTKSREIPVIVGSDSYKSPGQRASKDMMCLPPFTREMLQNIRQMQFETTSPFRYWTDEPLFEIKIYTPLKDVDTVAGKVVPSFHQAV